MILSPYELSKQQSQPAAEFCMIGAAAFFAFVGLAAAIVGLL